MIIVKKSEVHYNASAHGLNIYFDGIHGLKTPDKFSVDFVKKPDYQISVLRLLYVIPPCGIKPDKLLAEYELFEDMEVVRFRGNCRNIDNVA